MEPLTAGSSEQRLPEMMSKDSSMDERIGIIEFS
jgi:hypothetical protein